MRHIDKRLVIAGIACAGAGLFFGTTLLDALDAGVPSTAAVAARKPASSSTTATASKPAEQPITMQAVNEAVAIDPFSPDRQPSATPYKLPTDPAPETPPPPPPPPPAIPGFRLIGTMQTPAGATALLQVDNGTPRQVAVGESMSGYVIQKIGATSATLAQGDRSVDLQIQQPSLRGVDASGRRTVPPGRAGGPGRGGQQQQIQDAAIMQKQMVQEMQNMLQQQRANVTIDRIPVRVRPDTTSPRN